MGYYNSQYEDYYNRLRGKAGYSPHYNKIGDQNIRPTKVNYITRRIIRDLTGVLILSVIVVGCRAISTPQTKAVYNYSKKIVNQTYDYTKLRQDLSQINLKTIKDKAKNIIDRVQINMPQ
ncbi:endopeptidase [Clostridium sp. LBM24168]